MRIRKSVCSTALCALVLLSGSKTFAQIELFTTQEDFATGWGADGGNTLSSSASPFFDSDGSAINGGGNISIPSRGGPGTAGGMEIIVNNLASYGFRYSPELSNNADVTAALFKGSRVRFQYDILRPDPQYVVGETYFAGGLVYNYNNAFDLHGDPNGGATIIYQPGNPRRGTVTVDATITKANLFNPDGTYVDGKYFQVGVLWNTNDLLIDNPDDLNSRYHVDNFRIIPVIQGDFNLDAHVDARDISAMESALADPTGYLSTHPITAAELNTIGDFDGDTKLTNVDFQGFLNYLKAGSGSVAAVPEPASLVLVGLAIPAVVAVARRRRK